MIGYYSLLNKNKIEEIKQFQKNKCKKQKKKNKNQLHKLRINMIKLLRK